MDSSRGIEAPLPKGVTDFLPEKADKIGYIEGKIRRVFELWGFRRIITPLLEFQDVMALGMGEDLKERTFRFDDRQTGRFPRGRQAPRCRWWSRARRRDG